MDRFGPPPPAGPGPVRGLAALAAGAWTDIVSIIAPAQAAPGQTVNIEVRVKNIGGFGFYIAVTAQQDGVDIPMSPEYAGVDPGATYSFYGSFTMPNKSVRVSVWSFFWDGTSWFQDDYEYADIAMAIAYAGKIVDKWVNKAPEGGGLPMPAAVGADGNTFEVGVSYRNDSPVSITGGCEVKVTRPDGSVVAPAIDWAGMSPGKVLSVEYNIAKVNQAGNWNVVIRFLVSPALTELDRFSGVCLVAQLAVAEFRSFGMSEYTKV